MQHLMGLVRRCADDYNMIEAGDRIAVGVSGGKDSLALLALMAGLRKYYPKPFELEAITIDMGMGLDFSPVAAFCEKLGVQLLWEELPARGSEDFGYYTKKAPGTIFWVGNGEDKPGVHDSKFDFVDEIMKTATAVFMELAK